MGYCCISRDSTCYFEMGAPATKLWIRDRLTQYKNKVSVDSTDFQKYFWIKYTRWTSKSSFSVTSEDSEGQKNPLSKEK